MKMSINLLRHLLCLGVLFSGLILSAQKPQKMAAATPDSAKASPGLEGFAFRSIGPAFMSGRIADIALHPENPSIWYVAVGSGGVWKTENAGTTWTPIFDKQASYSIGCVTLDPSHPEVVWVGSGENVGGRHVGYGDGVYRSSDGGRNWTNQGLRQSEHISKIIVHPGDPNTVWVAAQGPLWSQGGERGVFKTTDGGRTWRRTLGDAEWVGATDLLLDPRDPKRLYAATWQRHRTVAGYLGGGPGTAIYRSEDGGETWTRLSQGLPTGSMGKIGLALSPQQPDVIYAAIELDRRTGGVFRSGNRGESWTKMSEEVSGGTGPHYYQELYACPHRFDRIYLVSNYMVRSEDGGKTFSRVNVHNKHVDDHAIAFRPDDPNYLLVGCDGGLYESFDLTRTWKYVSNLPVTQFYKIAVDDAQPFYNVFGGTQDNNTQGGPSRTDNKHGIQNSDWFVLIGGDGHQPATEPGNPDIVYGQWQQGNLMRHDRRSGENAYIQPMAAPGEPADRWNWDAPIVVSPHDPTHLYFASQRVWRSTDRGDTWSPISGDLTTGTERIATPFFGSPQSWDNAWDLYAMSNYSTITSLGVSPVQPGLMYAGTDDGLIQVTEDEGLSWRRIEVGNLPGLPATAFVNDIKADLHRANTVYAVFDNHKFGDFNPYLYRSDDKGRTWTRITADLPERTLLWRIVQDHEKPELLFLGAEFGVWFSHNGGRNWQPLQGGLPPIAVRDLAIQRRENDLVLGTFGRGIYILDDYSALRVYTGPEMANEAELFTPRDTWRYRPRTPLGNWGVSQGDQHYVAPNPPYGVTFHYRLRDSYQSRKTQRQAAEKDRQKAGQPSGFPGWETIETELREQEPQVWLQISDASGEILRRLPVTNAKGYQRAVWDLRKASPQPVLSETDSTQTGSGAEVIPGVYGARLYKEVDGAITPISESVRFHVKAMLSGSLPGSGPEEIAAFQERIEDLRALDRRMEHQLEDVKKTLLRMREAYRRGRSTDQGAESAMHDLQRQLVAFEQKWYGSKARQAVGEKEPVHMVDEYLWKAYMGGDNLSYGPTPTQRQAAQHAETLLQEQEKAMIRLRQDLEALGRTLRSLGTREWEVR